MLCAKLPPELGAVETHEVASLEVQQSKEEGLRAGKGAESKNHKWCNACVKVTEDPMRTQH